MATSWDYYSNWSTAPFGGQYRLHLSISIAATNTEANKTTLSYQLLIEKDRSGAGFYGYYVTSWNLVINGSTLASGVGPNPNSSWLGWNPWVLASGTTDIVHTDDGSKDVVVSSNYVRDPNEWAPGTMTIGSSTITLPDIARATQPSVAPSPATVGSTVTIGLPRAVGTFTHDVTWVCGTMSGTIGTGLGASTTWTVPAVLGEFPSRPNAPIVITAVTKSGGTPIGSKQVTLLAIPTPATPTVWVPNTSKQFDVRVREVKYTGGHWVAGRTIPTSKIQLADQSSATTTCDIDISKLVATNFPDYSVVDVDVFNGYDWLFTGHRFVLVRAQGDSVDPTQSWSHSGTEFIDYSLGLAYAQKDYEWTSATPGTIISTLIADAKSRGWGPRMDVTFSSTETSLSEPWINGAVALKVSKGTPLSQVLDGLVTDGLVEYDTNYYGDKAWLELLNPGTGSDFSAPGSSPVVNLAQAKLDRAPRRASSEKRLTRVTVVGDADLSVTREKSAFDADVFGQLEGWVSASGVTSAGDAGKVADNALADNSNPTDERTFEYATASNPPNFYPYFVFAPGDWVLIPSDGGPIKDRINQITVDKNTDGTSLTILTGDRILSGTASLAKRQSAQTGGAIAGGTGRTPPTLDSRIPASPVVNSVTSVGYWDSDGAAKSTVTASWSAVTAAVDGSPIVCDLYEVWWRLAGTGAQFGLRSFTDQLTLEMPNWDVLQNIELRIRGRSSAGIFGQFSENEPYTTLAPAVDLDGPIIADSYTDGVGGIYIVWAGILGTDPAPARLAYVSAEVSSDAGATYSTMGTSLSGPGTIVLNPNAWGDFKVRLRGYDRLGNAGDASAPVDITTADPHIDPPRPTAPTGLTSTPGADWDGNGINVNAWFDLAWTAPTLDTDGNAVTIGGYDIWGRRSGEALSRFITSSLSNSARVYVGLGETWTFEVRAASDFGGVSSFSSSVTDTANATVPAPGAPAAPTLDQYAGLLRIKWSGGGMTAPVKYVYASISTSGGGTYTRAGMPLQGSGEVVVPGLATGVTYYAKITMVDELGQETTSAASSGLLLDPITGITIQTSPVANTGIKMTNAALTAYDGSGVPTFVLDAVTGAVWIAPYDAVFHFGATGTTAETGLPVVGLAISSENSSFNTFVHPSGLQIRNDQTPISWWEADATDSSLVNFFSARANIPVRLMVGDYEFKKEAKSVGTRLVIRYKGA